MSKATRKAWTEAVTRLQQPRSKYGARKTTIDGIVFDSAKEARRWQELKALELAGEIRYLRRQPAFDLAVNGQSIGKYLADFEYIAPVVNAPIEIWSKVYEDVKGMKTPLYRWKKKHVEAQYGIQIREI